MTTALWKAGDVLAWRGIYKSRIWHAQAVTVVADQPEEIVLALMPGAECVAPPGYFQGVKNHWWDFKEGYWEIEKSCWHTRRLLILLEPEKYYSTIYFWDAMSNEFLNYYMNFELPFQRSHCGIDILDLELDLIINPDYSYKWKDAHHYQDAVDKGVISAEWIQGIETGKAEIFDKLDKHHYPFDGSWLNWKPDPTWSPPMLPENWDKM